MFLKTRQMSHFTTISLTAPFWCFHVYQVVIVFLEQLQDAAEQKLCLFLLLYSTVKLG